MPKKVPPNNPVTATHFAGADPKKPQGKLDPCRHRRNKKKQKFVVYMAEEIGSTPPKFYIGRTRGTGPSVPDIVYKRQQGHHRTDIGPLKEQCEHDSYAACRGAEQLHYLELVKNNQQITTPKPKGKAGKGKGPQIAPIAKDNPKKDDYLACAKASAKNSKNPCPICSA